MREWFLRIILIAITCLPLIISSPRFLFSSNLFSFNCYWMLFKWLLIFRWLICNFFLEHALISIISSKLQGFKTTTRWIIFLKLEWLSQLNFSSTILFLLSYVARTRLQNARHETYPVSECRMYSLFLKLGDIEPYFSLRNMDSGSGTWHFLHVNKDIR